MTPNPPGKAPRTKSSRTKCKQARLRPWQQYQPLPYEHRGRTKAGSERVYGIKQNEAREIYLAHYYGLDNADHMVKNAGNWYITCLGSGSTGMHHIFMHSLLVLLLHMICTLNAVREDLMPFGQWM